jgi:KUP system potassium uptake protein
MVWHDGRDLLARRLDAMSVGTAMLGQLLTGTSRVKGTAIFLASRPDSIPGAFLRNLEHNHVVHENVIFLHIDFLRVPKVDAMTRMTIEELRESFYAVRARFGFMETPDVGALIQQCSREGLNISSRDYTLFLGQHVVVPTGPLRPHYWKRRFFAWLQRRSTGAAEFFGMPLRRVVIVSTVIEI